MWGKRERDQVVRNAQRYLNGWAGSWLSEQLQLYCKQMATFKRNSIHLLDPIFQNLKKKHQ